MTQNVTSIYDKPDVHRICIKDTMHRNVSLNSMIITVTEIMDTFYIASG